MTESKDSEKGFTGYCFGPGFRFPMGKAEEMSEMMENCCTEDGSFDYASMMEMFKDEDGSFDVSRMMKFMKQMMEEK